MWSGSAVLSSIFLDASEPAYEIARSGLPLLGLCALPFAVNITFIGYYQSSEKAARAIVCMLLRGIVLMVPGFVLLPRLTGVAGLWLAIAVSETLTLVYIALSYALGRRSMK